MLTTSVHVIRMVLLPGIKAKPTPISKYQSVLMISCIKSTTMTGTTQQTALLMWSKKFGTHKKFLGTLGMGSADHILSTFFFFRHAKHATVFCFYCCKGVRRDYLHQHCSQVHDEQDRALKYGEKPVKPIFTNWQLLTLNWGSVPAIVDTFAKERQLRDRRARKVQDKEKHKPLPSGRPKAVASEIDHQKCAQEINQLKATQNRLLKENLNAIKKQYSVKTINV